MVNTSDAFEFADSSFQVSPQNRIALEELVGAIAFSQGANALNLLLVRCNYTQLRQQMMEALLTELKGESLDGPIHVLPNGTNLQIQLRGVAQNGIPGAVIVLVTETGADLDALLVECNKRREEFRHEFRFPVVLWLTNTGYQQLSQLANDFESIAGGEAIAFGLSGDELTQMLQNAAQGMFAALLKSNSPASLNQRLEDMELGYLRTDEVAIALSELRSQNHAIPAELEASITFAQGLNKRPEDAAPLFERSQNYWQTHADSTDARLKQGVALFYLGRARYFAENNVQYHLPKWERAIPPLSKCLDILKQNQRPDLVSVCIVQIERVLYRLRRWDELEKTVTEALSLHKKYSEPTTIAQDYGFLADIALQRKQWQTAIDSAQKALALVSQLQEKSWWQRLYLKLLAKAEYGLGNIGTAIKHLKNAQNMGVMDHPYDYSDLLKLLQLCLRKQGQYLEAFDIKQERLIIDKQYGVRAFIGASCLQSQRREERATVRSERQMMEGVSPEIAVSERAQDLDELLSRIAGTNHKLIVLHGESGVGKSSLVNGGLVPELLGRSRDNRKNVPILLRRYTNWQVEIIETFDSASSPVNSRLDNTPADAHIRLNRLNVPDLRPLDSKKKSTIFQAIMPRLQQWEEDGLRPVLIFDQFEEFFFANPDPILRQEFFQFIADCLDFQPSALKIIFSLRHDYLHYLLEAKQLVKGYTLNEYSMARNQLENILGKQILYEIGNFSPQDTKAIIYRLTIGARMYWEPELIETLVTDLADSFGSIRPIEMQIVGSQLQADRIQTLEEYQQLGDSPKETLVQRYLADIVSDCGPQENQKLADLVLFLLTDERGTRPIKTKSELEHELARFLSPRENDLLNSLDTEQSSSEGFTFHGELENILHIFCQSGIVNYLFEIKSDRYQLVHDYIAEIIRSKKSPQLTQLISDLEKERSQRKRAEIEKAMAEQRTISLQKSNKLSRQRLINILKTSIFSIAMLFVGGFWVLYNFATDTLTNEIQTDLRSTLKGAAQGVNVEELMSLYREGEVNEEGFSDDPRYSRQLDWFATVQTIEPRAWSYSFVVIAPPEWEDKFPLPFEQLKEITVDQYETIWLVDLWANHPEFRHERAANFLEKEQEDTNSWAILVKNEGKLYVYPEVYDDQWGAWLSAFAPLKDKQGKVVAIIGVDIEADEVRTLQKRMRDQFLIAFFTVEGVLVSAYFALLQRAREKKLDI